MPFSPGRISPRNMDDRQWATFVAQAGIQADGKVKTFPATWTGFAVAPTGEISYMDFGAIVMLWNDDASDNTGTSNAVGMGWSSGSLPAAIRPTSGRVVSSLVVDASSTVVGFASVLANGSVEFAVANTVGLSPLIILDSGGFNGGAVSKGLPTGWLITYPK